MTIQQAIEKYNLKKVENSDLKNYTMYTNIIEDSKRIKEIWLENTAGVDLENNNKLFLLSVRIQSKLCNFDRTYFRDIIGA